MKKLFIIFSLVVMPTFLLNAQELKSNTLSFSEILTLLIRKAETKVKASELIEACRKYKMQQMDVLSGHQLFSEFEYSQYNKQ